LASIRLGQIQESGNQLHLAAETYRRVLQRIDEYSPPNAPIAYLGLARICYEWNDLDAAGQYAEQSLKLARQYDQVIDRLILSELFLCRLKLARGDVAGAAGALAQAEQEMRRSNNTFRLQDKAAAQAMILLRQGNIGGTAQLAQKADLPLIQARVLIAQGDPSAALGVFETFRQTAVVKAWASLLIQVMVVQSIALYKTGEKEKAVALLGEVLARAEPEGFIRLFLDEGDAMVQLLLEAASRGIMPDYIGKLLAAFEAGKRKSKEKPDLPPQQPLIEPLSQRELKIIHLIAQGLSNREIGERLFLALDTIKGHNRKIFDKLQVQSRTEAIARARELGLL
jgi:LuxR family maltose regulon positive regulatory protein